MKSTLLLPLLAGIVYAQAEQEDASAQIIERQRKEACLSQCGENDVDCHAICNKAPHPKAIHMDLMTECVRHCDVLKGDGNAASLKEYGICHDSCIGGYMNLGNSQAAPTTKTWVDLVTPTTYLLKTAGETAASVATAASDLAHGQSGDDHAEATGSESAIGEFVPGASLNASLCICYGRGPSSHTILYLPPTTFYSLVAILLPSSLPISKTTPFLPPLQQNQTNNNKTNNPPATPVLTTISGLVSTMSPTGTASKPQVSTASPSATGQSSLFGTGDEKAATSAASHQIAAAGSLIAVFVVGLILL